MRAIHVEFALLTLLIIFLLVGAFLSQDQPIEVGIEIPGSIIRQGIFHGKVEFVK